MGTRSHSAFLDRPIDIDNFVREFPLMLMLLLSVASTPPIPLQFIQVEAVELLLRHNNRLFFFLVRIWLILLDIVSTTASVFENISKLLPLLLWIW